MAKTNILWINTMYVPNHSENYFWLVWLVLIVDTIQSISLVPLYLSISLPISFHSSNCKPFPISQTCKGDHWWGQDKCLLSGCTNFLTGIHSGQLVEGFLFRRYSSHRLNILHLNILSSLLAHSYQLVSCNWFWEERYCFCFLLILYWI